jgi:hypothetical protein
LVGVTLGWRDERGLGMICPEQDNPATRNFADGVGVRMILILLL